MHGLVHAARHAPDVIVAVVRRRAAEVAKRVAAGDGQDGGDPLAFAGRLRRTPQRECGQCQRHAGGDADQQEGSGREGHQAGAGSSNL